MRHEVKRFGYFEPRSLEEAVSLLSKYGPAAKVIAGGSDLLSRIKNEVQTHIPRYVVDITGLGLSYISFSDSDGLRVGATTPVSELESHPIVRKHYPVLAEAAEAVGSPQIRNVATVAGDILQEVWCPYLRYNYDCWRNGGRICYGAIGDNRYYHSIFGGRLCYAVHAGDITPALFALGAWVKVRGPRGERSMRVEDLVPGITLVDGRIKENVLRYNEILTEIHVPKPPAGARGTFYKIRDRGTWDFALASAAVQLVFDGARVVDARVVLGGVDVKPRRAEAVEQFLIGKTLTEDVILAAGERATAGAIPLTFGTGNDFRLELTQAAVKKALRRLAGLG
jgi:xanthine dehydrogenase YagS FAD-binding subunit